MIFLLMILSVPLICEAADKEMYTNRYDNLNIDEMLQNKRLTKAYIHCVLEKGKCTAEGRELKSHISEALQNGCQKCTKNQLHGVRKVIKHLINNEDKYWKELVNMYDSSGKYRSMYERELKSIIHNNIKQ